MHCCPINAEDNNTVFVSVTEGSALGTACRDGECRTKFLCPYLPQNFIGLSNLYKPCRIPTFIRVVFTRLAPVSLLHLLPTAVLFQFKKLQGLQLFIVGEVVLPEAV